MLSFLLGIRPSNVRRHAMLKAVSREPLVSEARDLSRTILYEVFGGQSDIRTVFSPCTTVFPCQYHSTNAPYPFSSCYSYQNDKPSKTGNIPQSNALSETEEYWIEKYFHGRDVVNQLIC
jgi:hypothetical protein